MEQYGMSASDVVDTLKRGDPLIEGMAQGGRIGFKDGPDMGRRNFLKILGGLASIPIVGKFFKVAKVGKTVTKVPVIKTADVAGKPEWFDALVNKVILEGDDVTKKFATGERQTVHSKDLGDGTTVRVTQDTDQGAVRVEYESDANVYGDPVQLQYKKPLPDEGDPNPAAEFSTAESGPVGRSKGPDDYEIELDEVGGISISDLSSDVSKLKEYATGKKPTMKEFIQNKKRKDRAKNISEGGESEMDEVIRRQGEFIQFEDIDPNMASGGRVGLAAGKFVKLAQLLKNKKKIDQAVNNIFPTGDYKMDAEMAAESLVELNPKVFGNKLYEDLDDKTRIDIYGAVINQVQKNNLMASKIKKASKPTKTLEGIEKTGTINISDPAIAEEFAKFMKETSPGDAKKVEQTVELMNFDPKGRKKNNAGGVAYMLGE